ncbi:alpha/beta fold hydrolase [Amycolatopsis keratiniphila]|uniref:alpha/beta fold hydrolase n=1 Tax=Amycolatopsis keratiniphila TaxID=129921 RepID=UPI00087D47A7|nr:alpha/beta hydrolase [Amycolatopsis keratiniphila]OLZ45869.1 alpha/beta hydrolase [Amycolatopsis keratiniphila subsp. nogabecina]SDU13334.1 proline iminopeptidase [Amycolatopsis keratiniphila]
MITDDGRELWTSATGRGEPILCCHGGPGLWDMFGTLDLGPRFRLIRWDQRGAGRSETRGPYTLERMVADVEAVREWHGVDRVPVLGHSWGAHLALLYALAHPERVSALVYVSGVGLGHEWHAEFERNFERALGEELRGEGRERAVRQWTADFVTDGELHAEAMATPWFPVNYEANAALSEEMRTVPEAELVSACRSLRVPTLIVDGMADNRPRWAVDSLERALPSVTRVRFDGVGHVPWLEAPGEFRAAVTDFLAGS